MISSIGANNDKGGTFYHLIQGSPLVLVLQAGLVALDSQVFLGHSQVFQEHQLPLEILEDQEPLVAQEVPSCLQGKLRVEITHVPKSICFQYI